MPDWMHGYVALPMLAAVVNAACAGAFLVEGPDRPPNRLTAALLGGASLWALCEVAWNLAPDPESWEALREALLGDRISAAAFGRSTPSASPSSCSAGRPT